MLDKGYRSLYVPHATENRYRLYDQFGDALFLENIREFLGVLGQKNSLTDVNREILETLEEDPVNFLAKNNGITFRASQVNQANGHLEKY